MAESRHTSRWMPTLQLRIRRLDVGVDGRVAAREREKRLRHRERKRAGRGDQRRNVRRQRQAAGREAGLSWKQREVLNRGDSLPRRRNQPAFIVVVHAEVPTQNARAEQLAQEPRRLRVHATPTLGAKLNRSAL